MSAPTNPALDVIDGIIHGIIYDIGVEGIMVDLIAAQPWLGLPLVRNIVRLLLNMFAGKLYRKIAPFVDAKVIKFQNEAQRKSYDDAIAALIVANNAGDVDAIEKAKDKVKSDLDKLINFNK